MNNVTRAITLPWRTSAPYEAHPGQDKPQEIEELRATKTTRHENILVWALRGELVVAEMPPCRFPVIGPPDFLRWDTRISGNGPTNFLGMGPRPEPLSAGSCNPHAPGSGGAAMPAKAKDFRVTHRPPAPDRGADALCGRRHSVNTPVATSPPTEDPLSSCFFHEGMDAEAN